MYLSPFQISLFLQCPLKYRLQYVDGLGDVFGRPRSYFSFGNTIHQTLRDYYRLGGPSQNPFPLLYKLYRSLWQGIEPVEEGYRDREEAEDYYYRGYYMLKNYYRRHQDEDRETLYIEESFKEEILSGITLGGRIDRVAKTPDGYVEIIDYKTGKRVPKKEELREDIQPAIYYYLVKRKFKEERVRIINYYLFKDTMVQLEEVALGEENLKELAKRLKGEFDRGIFPSQKNRFCSFCDFLLLCPQMMKDEESMGPRMREKILGLAREEIYDSPILSLRAALLALEDGDLSGAEALFEGVESKELELSKEQDSLYRLKKAELYLKQKRKAEAREELLRFTSNKGEGVDLPGFSYLYDWLQISLERKEGEACL